MKTKINYEIERFSSSSQFSLFLAVLGREKTHFIRTHFFCPNNLERPKLNHSSVTDPERFDSDPDPTFQADADPDPKMFS